MSMYVLRSSCLTVTGALLALASGACVAHDGDSRADGPISAEPTAAAAWTAPPVNGQFDYQLGGAYTPAASVQIVDRDRTASPVTGKYNICYLNAMQTQPDEPGQSKTNPPYGTTQWWILNHPTLLVHDASGAIVVDSDWNEAIFDVSTAANRDALLAIQKPWIAGCASAGFQAVEPDNLDSYARSGGAFAFGADSAYMSQFVAYAHGQGLAVAQKNAGEEFGATGKTIGFDFAIAEECEYNNECDTYTNVYGAAVIEIEYTYYAASVYNNACTKRGAKISIIRRDRDVVPSGTSGYSYTSC